MMKKIISCIFLAATMFAATSCLTETPYGTYSSKTFFQTEEDADNSLMYSYVPINYIEYCGRMMLYFGDVPTDQFKEYSIAGGTPLYRWDVQSATEELLYFFKTAYTSTARVNNVLQWVPGMSISESSKNRILGEAHFLRAFNHFMLVITYGPVPLRDKLVEGVSDAYKDFASIQDLYTFIIKELETAESQLPVKKLQGRVDKVAAQVLLSRVYLYLASFKESGRPESEWVSSADAMYAKSAEYASKVLNEQSEYYLEPDLVNIYDCELYQSCPEHIWVTSMNREASGMEGTYSQLPQMFTIQINDYVYVPKRLGETPAGPDDVVLMLNDKTCYQALRVDADFRANKFQDGDLRKELMVTTIYTEDGKKKAQYSPENPGSQDPILQKYFYPFCRKYSDPKSKGSHCSTNLYLIRFAEVALTYAEAVGPTEEGYKWVNEVRQRAGLDKLATGLDKTAFRNEVIKERERELCFEGQGLYDLRRLGRVNETYITNKKIAQPQYAYFFPVPQRELDLNPQKQ